MKIIDEQEIKKGLSVIHPDGELFEVRIIGNDGKTNYSGYFRDPDTLITELKKIDLRGCNIYMTLNELKEACGDRVQSGKFIKSAKNTTSDNDIERLKFLFIDLDPKRPAGVSSSEDELQKAKDLGNKVFTFLRSNGFYAPITAYSGNGVHMLYRIDMERTKDNVAIIEKCQKTLGLLFSNEDVDIDLKTFNPARVCKLYGTLAQKGSNTEKRPFRMSSLNRPVHETQVTGKEYLEKVADMLPKEPEKPQRYNNFSPRDFDLEEWMRKHDIGYREAPSPIGRKYILDHCPFDESHKGKDACIFRMDNGAIGFHCFHNSCAGKQWRDVRIKFEPEAYEKREQYQEARMYRSYNRDRVAPLQEAHISEKEGDPVFYSASDILNMPQKEESFVRTGTTVIDKKMRGLKKGSLSLVSGLRGASKSTVLSQWALTGINDGFNVGVYSGELNPRNFMRWMNQQAAGRNRVIPSDRWEGYYTVPNSIQTQIADWMDGKFFLYNNEYGNDFLAICEQFEKKIEDNKLDILFLDNLMAFNISGLADNKWDAQTAFVWKLHDIAERKNVHIVFVAHPRKAQGFLRLDDVSGSADLANAVDNAFIVHRNNLDFQKKSSEMFGWRDSDEVYTGTNVIEIAKDRDGGTQDEFIPLWYEKESKRLKNTASENVVYGWDDGPQQPIMMPIEDWSDADEIEEPVFN